MKLLLDTVALYRAATNPDAIPGAVRAILTDESNQVFVSLVSAWEMAIKASLGKLVLPCRIGEFFSQSARDLLAESIGLDLRFVAKVAELPAHHGDPFDRLIIAQALVEDLSVVTSDARFADYGVKVVW